MADAAFERRAPLAHLAGPNRIGNLGATPGVTLRAENGLHLLLLAPGRNQSAELRRAVQDLRLTLPAQPSAVPLGDGVVLWCGPDQWLVVTRSPQEMLRRVGSGLGLAVDLSDARAVITLSGSKARAALAKACGLDLHPRVFKAGDTALTPIFGIAAQIWQKDDEPAYSLAVPRSSAETLWHWLSEACAEYGLNVVA